MIENGRREDIEFGENDADELVQMLMRFWHASEIGTARENLELLAKVIVGLKRNQALVFDQFQNYANTLESLTRDEILLIGIVYDTIKEGNVEAKFEIMREALKPTFDLGTIFSLFASLTRTGLFIPSSAYGGLIYYPSSKFWEICKLAVFTRRAR